MGDLWDECLMSLDNFQLELPQLFLQHGHFTLGLSFPWIYALSPNTLTSPSHSLFPDFININWERDSTWFVHWHAIFQLHMLNNCAADK